MNAPGLGHEFVEFIPPRLQGNTLYVSMKYAIAVHLCPCGCGNKVVTPLSPAEWRLIYDGDSVSLEPSVGNWEFPCRSHYWITRDQIIWARAWNKEEIARGRQRDEADLAAYLDAQSQPAHAGEGHPGRLKNLFLRLSRRR